MPTRREVVDAFDAIAEEFAPTRTRPWPETEWFAASLPETVRVLDLGCGNGRNFPSLADHHRTVIGLDASSRLLAHAPATGTLARGDAIHLPFRDGAFGAVHSVAVIHHLAEDEERAMLVREIARVLERGGPVLLSAWALEQDRFLKGPSDAREGRGFRVPWRRRDGTVVDRFYRPFAEGELDALAASGGLDPVRGWREGDNHVVFASRA